MSYLHRVFNRRSLKALLTICCIALIVAAIWLLGPFFGFGESRPLLSAESRLIFILLSVLTLVSFWLRWPLFIVLSASLCVLIWVFGSFLLAGDSHPLAAIGARVVIIAAVLVITLLYALWLLLLALKDNPALLDKFIRNAPTAAEEDTSEVTSAIASAVEYVNKNRSNLSFFQRVILARKPLDVLPWYMMLGTEEAGKTSAILASGQNFPLPEQLNLVGKPATQTRNCECCFANDAIYIDTAGKYVGEAEKHLGEWKAMLKALKKYRPVKALNGVVVAFLRSQCNGAQLSRVVRAGGDFTHQNRGFTSDAGRAFPGVCRGDKARSVTRFCRVFQDPDRAGA